MRAALALAARCSTSSRSAPDSSPPAESSSVARCSAKLSMANRKSVWLGCSGSRRRRRKAAVIRRSLGPREPVVPPERGGFAARWQSGSHAALSSGRQGTPGRAPLGGDGHKTRWSNATTRTSR
eukprot:2478285-Prymnesium_polylepis.1